jgi:hypothetical protein
MESLRSGCFSEFVTVSTTEARLTTPGLLRWHDASLSFQVDLKRADLDPASVLTPVPSAVSCAWPPSRSKTSVATPMPSINTDQEVRTRRYQQRCKGQPQRQYRLNAPGRVFLGCHHLGLHRGSVGTSTNPSLGCYHLHRRGRSASWSCWPPCSNVHWQVPRRRWNWVSLLTSYES